MNYRLGKGAAEGGKIMLNHDELQALIEADLDAWPEDGRSMDVLSAAFHYAQTYAEIPCDEIVEMVTREAKSRGIRIEPHPN
jgi:hypothetical protein